jgi:hypothetical protein
MAKTTTLSLALAALLGASAPMTAWAQQNVDRQQAQELKQLDTVPPATGKSAPEQAGTAEPSAKGKGAPGPSTGIFVDGRLSVPDAPQDGQTVPSTISAHNAALDKLPIAAFRLHHLTDAQRAVIWRQLHGGSGALAMTPAHARVGAEIPADRALTDLRPTPDGLIVALPGLRDTSYLVEGSVVLIVAPNNNMVIGVIAEP